MAELTVDVPDCTLQRARLSAQEDGVDIAHYVNRALLNQVSLDGLARAAQAMIERERRGEPGE